MKKLLVTGVILGMISSLSFAGQETRNGGDGVYKDGELILRDLLENEGFNKVKDSEDFLKTAPGFMKIIRKIGEQDRELSVALYSAIVDTTIWTTNGRLPLLPQTETTIYETKAEVQIAIRDAKNIYISLPAYNKTDKGYLLLHEAVHLVAKGTEAKKHFNVRAFVRYVNKNIKNLEAHELETYLDKEFVYNKSRIISYDNNELLDVLVNKKGSVENRCELASFLIYEPGVSRLLKIFDPDIYDCANPERAMAYLKREIQVTYQDARTSVPEFERVEPKRRLLKNKKYQEEKMLCEKNTDKMILEKINLANDTYLKLDSDLEDLSIEEDREVDQARKMYLNRKESTLRNFRYYELEHNLDWRWGGYSSATLARLKAMYESNVKKCREAGYL